MPEIRGEVFPVRSGLVGNLRPAEIIAMSLKVAIESIMKEKTPEGLSRVRAIGGTTLGGGRWMLLENQAITAIERCRSEFFVTKEGRQVPVIIGITPEGTKFLKSEEDGMQADTLLALPDYSARF